MLHPKMEGVEPLRSHDEIVRDFTTRYKDTISHDSKYVDVIDLNYLDGTIDAFIDGIKHTVNSQHAGRWELIGELAPGQNPNELVFVAYLNKLK